MPRLGYPPCRTGRGELRRHDDDDYRPAGPRRAAHRLVRRRRFLALFVLAKTFAIVWQWVGVFLRSDGYAVLANALRCHDLCRITWLTAKNRLVRLPVAEREELAAAGARDQSVARWFGAVFIVGMIATLWVYANVVVPSAVGLFGWVGADVTGLAVDTVAFWESAAVLALLVVQYGLPPVLALRERRLRKAGVLR
jgi:putative peptide zinc metalloprotease protein